MNLCPNTVRQLREARAWSQEHLAAVASLSLRTVQRVESEGNASAETRMALATAFEVDLQRLQPAAAAVAEVSPAAPVADATPGPLPSPPVPAERLPYRYYRLLRFAVVIALLVGLDIYETGGVTWSRWVLVFGMALFALRAVKPRFEESGDVRRRRSGNR